MLHTLKHTDRAKLISETDSLVKKYLEEDASLNQRKFDEESLNMSEIRELSETHSLFGNKSLVIIDNVREELQEELDRLKTSLELSPNIFILRELEISLAKKEYKNTFHFTDAIGERNKRQAWIIFQELIHTGQTGEELFYKLMWLIKSMLLASKVGETESGLNPFVYKKSKSFLKNWKEGEIEKLSESLVIGFHEARRKNKEIETMLEKTILSL